MFMWNIDLLNTVNTGKAGSGPQLDIQPVQLTSRSLGYDLDPPVWQVGRPATQPQRLRLPEHEPPESDALYPARDPPAGRFNCHWRHSAPGADGIGLCTR